MAIYEINNNNLSPVKSVPFSQEKEIQIITEKNLDVIFGLEFIQTEYTLSNFRIDTLAFDPQSNAFAIIEYKKNENFHVIDQGYAYLASMLSNKADFILEYNDKMQSPLKKNDVDWSQSRVLFVSPSFTIYQKQAINFENLPIELWEIKRYSNNTLSYNKIRASQAAGNFNVIPKGSKAIKKVSDEIKTYTEEELLSGCSSKIEEVYSSLKKEIYLLYSDADEKIGKTMVNFSIDGRGLVFVRPQKNKIIIWLRKGKYYDKNEKLLPDGWGGYPTITFSEDEFDIDYLKELIKKAYEY